MRSISDIFPDQIYFNQADAVRSIVVSGGTNGFEPTFELLAMSSENAALLAR